MQDMGSDEQEILVARNEHRKENVLQRLPPLQ
jgi:hypothetical protein